MIAPKTAPQVTLETIMKKNRKEAEDLFTKAKELIYENRRIESEMSKILSEPPPTTSIPESAIGRVKTLRPEATNEVIFAAQALVRSWKRRNKKNFKTLEQDLLDACARMANGSHGG